MITIIYSLGPHFESLFLIRGSMVNLLLDGEGSAQDKGFTFMNQKMYTLD